MAVYERPEFRKLCGVTNGYLKTNIDRGKVILTDDGKIDGNVEANAVFKKKCEQRKAGREAEQFLKNVDVSTGIPPEVLKAKPEKGSKQLPINTDKEELQTKKQEINSDRWDLETNLKRLTLQKSEQELRMAQLREEKLRGDLIPWKLANVVVKTSMTSISSEMKKFIDDYINIFAIRKDLSSQDRADITGETYRAFNEAIERAADNSEREMIRLADEFSNTRGVGEHG